MNHTNSNLDKITGTVKENAGKIIGSEQLELEGKLQRKRGEASEATCDLGESLKEKASEKVNNFIDKFDKDKDDKE